MVEGNAPNGEDDSVPTEDPVAGSGLDFDDGESSVDKQELAVIRQEALLAIEKIPEKSRTPEQIATVVTRIVSTHRLYRGPTPSPRTLHELKLVDPSYPDRVLGYVEREQASRHRFLDGQLGCAKREQILAFVTRTIGQVFAALIVLVVIGATAVLSYFDKQVSQISPIVYSLAALAVALIAAKSVESWVAHKAAQSEPESDE